MADLLTSVSKELAARLDELRPLVEEHARLERALAALEVPAPGMVELAGLHGGPVRRQAGAKWTRAALPQHTVAGVRREVPTASPR